MTHQQSGYPHDPATPAPYPVGQDPFPPTPPQSNSKTILIIAVCVAIMAALGSGAVIIFGFGDDGSGNTAQSGPDSDDTAPDTGGDDTGGEDEDTGSDEDLTDLSPLTVTHDYPENFSITNGSMLLTPLFDDYTVEFQLMDGVSTYESIFVASYVTDTDTTGFTQQQLLDEVSSYASRIGKLNSDLPESRTINGKTAIYNYLEQAGNSSTVTYDAYFFFDGPYLIQVGCQPEEEAEAVKSACDTVLNSLSW